MQKKEEKTKPMEEVVKNKSTSATLSAVESIKDTINFDTSPETENFRVQAPRRDTTTLREKFTSSQPVNMVTDFDQSEKISRILRLIEQNKTGYERPAVQDMVLYIATGVFFLFTFDTFVMLGKTMRRR